MSRKFNRRSASAKKNPNPCHEVENHDCCGDSVDIPQILYCARDVIPRDATGVPIRIELINGSEYTLRHGDVIPDDINGIIAVKDASTNELKFIQGQVSLSVLRSLIDEFVSRKDYANKCDVAKCCEEGKFDMNDISTAVKAILLDRDYINSDEACKLFDQKIKCLNLGIDENAAKLVFQTCISAIELGISSTDAQALINASLSGLEFGIDEDDAQSLIDDSIDGLGGCVTGLSTNKVGESVTLTLSQSDCEDVSTTFDVGSSDNGLIPRTDAEILAVTKPQTESCVQDALAGLPPQSTVSSGTMICTDSGLVTTTLNQTNAQPAVITADFSKFLSESFTPRTDAEIQALAKPVAQTCVDAATPAIQASASMNAQAMITAAINNLPTSLTYCLSDLDLTVSDGVITATIQQDNCQSISGSATLPAGSVTNSVTGGSAVCTDEGVVTLTINQSGAAPASIVWDQSKFFDDTDTNLSNQDVIDIVQPLIDASAGESNCIQSHTFAIDNNVLSLTTVQENCDNITSSITLPEGAVSSTVTGLTQECDDDGNLTTSVSQSGASAVSVTTDLSKFLDNITLTNEQVQTIAKPVAEQCVQDAIDELPDVGAQNTQAGSSLVCDENSNLTLTISQSTGPDVVVTEDLSEKLNSDDVHLESASYEVINPNTVDSGLEITHTLSDGSTVDVSIAGSDLVAAISAFFTCETVIDPLATCKEYTSLQIDGDELCQLEGYTTPENYCKTYCLDALPDSDMTYSGLGEFTLTTSTGTWSVIWPDGSTQTVDSGSTVTYDFTGELLDENGEPLQLTICHDDPCAETSGFAINPRELQESLTKKDCGC